MFFIGNSHCDGQERLVAAMLPKGNDSVFEPKAIELRVDLVLRMLGYSDLDHVRPVVRSITELVTERVKQAVKPVVCFKRMAIESCVDGALVVDAGVILNCRAFEKYLTGCDEVVAFFLTLGKSIDEVEAEYAAKDQLLEMLVLETAGWLGIEQATKQLAIHLREIVSVDGRRLSRRMAPGYGYKIGSKKCEWLLEEQRVLFELFDQQKLPVQLLSSCAMVPKMSRSGLYGLRPS